MYLCPLHCDYHQTNKVAIFLFVNMDKFVIKRSMTDIQPVQTNKVVN